MRDLFLKLIRFGINTTDDIDLPSNIDWTVTQALAIQHGLSSIVLDGIERIPEGSRPPKALLLGWIGLVMQDEARYNDQKLKAIKLASLFHKNDIRTYVLKGEVVSECYPRPEHRVSSDLDCFLVSEKGTFDAWSLGNDLIKSKGYEVETLFYKNSTFFIPGLTVENHQFLTPFRGNERLTAFEKKLQSLIREYGGDNRLEGTWLYRPPVMVSALFLIEHAYSHFLHEGLTWRMVLDWMMFSLKHEKEIDWYALSGMIDEFGFREFYETYNHLGKYLLGEFPEKELSKKDKLMLEDVWTDLDLHETVRGIKGKMALVGNTLRARWKYHHFSEDSMLKALWIQVKGVLFEKKPTLN